MSQNIWSYEELKCLIESFEKMIDEPKNIYLQSNLINEHIENYDYRTANAIKRRIELINFAYKNSKLNYLQNYDFTIKPGGEILNLINEIILELHPNQDVVELKIDKSIPFTFINTDDFDEFIMYISEKLNDFRNIIPKFQEDSEILLDELTRLQEFINEISNNTFEEDLNIEQEWEDIDNLLQKRYPKQRDAIEIYWGEWRAKTIQKYEFGYTKDYLIAGEVDLGDNVKRHKYAKIPPDVIWDLVPIEQKGKTFYITKAVVCEIEQLSEVPSLPDTLTSQDTAKRILDSEIAKNQWQRRPDGKRIASIESFANSENNIIANTPMLFVNKSEFVKIDKERNKAIFSFQFLKEKGYSFVDYHKFEDIVEDLRPLWLIDGQHRIRGLSRSTTGSELVLPLVLFPNEFGQANAAKIFAEINTLQTGLKPLHTLFMQYRFSIPSAIKSRDFKPWKNEPTKNINSRANNLSYELLALLSSKKNSPLFNMVNFLEQNIVSDKTAKVVSADQWVNYTRNWFIGGPFNDYNNDNNLDIIYQEVVSYFTAFIKTCEINDGKSAKGWVKELRKTMPLIQRKTHFQILLAIYPLVRRKLFEKYYDKSIYDENQYFQILKPLENIDWYDSKLISTFGGGGEKGRKCLEKWIEEAIENGVSYEFKDVMSEIIHSERGKGILASPGKCEIINFNNVTFPTKQNHVELISYRPHNTMSTATWTIYDELATDLFGPEKKSSRRESGTDKDISIFKIELTKENKKIIEKAGYLKVRVEWYNAVNPNSHSEILLIKK